MDVDGGRECQWAIQPLLPLSTSKETTLCKEGSWALWLIEAWRLVLKNINCSQEGSLSTSVALICTSSGFHLQIPKHLPKLRNCHLHFTVVKPEEVTWRLYYKEKRGLSTETKDQIRSYSTFYAAGFFPPVVLNQRKAMMYKSLKFKCDAVEDAIWRWKSLCEFLWLLQA